MENHYNRKEISEARNLNYGTSIRHSNTVNKDLLYVSKKIVINDDIYYLRLADYTKKITEDFTSLSYQIIGFIALFVIIAFIVTYFFSIKIKNETNSILVYLLDMLNGSPKKELNSNFSEEFNKITRLLNKVSNRLSKKQRQKSKQNAKLKIANKQKDEIISAISHEFKNPIAIIKGYSQTILSDKDIPESMKEKFLNKIVHSSDKMSQIIDKLRLTLKLEEGKQELITVNVSLKTILQDIISDLNDKYQNRYILIEGEDITLKVDETLFSMAVSNLIENALKYSDQDVIVRISKNSISIIDKGLGIDEYELDKINQKFYRVSQNGWNNSLGLGLFIVTSILRLHGYKLEIKSKLNIGSEFIINY